jgi:hypothetical protein
MNVEKNKKDILIFLTHLYKVKEIVKEWNKLPNVKVKFVSFEKSCKVMNNEITLLYNLLLEE